MCGEGGFIRYGYLGKWGVEEKRSRMRKMGRRLKGEEIKWGGEEIKGEEIKEGRD